MAALLQHSCCFLAQERTDANYNSLKNLLLQGVWNYFSVDRQQETKTSEEQDGFLDKNELLASLISASLSGCTLALDHILYFSVENLCTDVPISELMNTRLPCNFPIPDTWIHKTVCLAMSPLHMACWRLDFVMIQKLLSIGADPNCLAWEIFGVDVKENQSCANAESNIDMEDQGCEGIKTRVTLHGLKFDTSLGFSPLHFIALGLRSPPRNSLSEGTKHRIIHDVCETYESSIIQLKTTDEAHNPYQLAHELYPLQSYEETDIKSEIIESCIKLLLSAGADPNSGRAHYLSFYYPLDVIIQPPIRIYYASRVARSTQTSESLCRQNFEFNLFQIRRATRSLLHAGAKLSHNFLSTHTWNIRFLDCFYTQSPQSVFSFVESLFFLGVFPDTTQTLEQLRDDEARGVCPKNYMMKFIVDAINIPAPESLVALILKSCSMALLHQFIETGRAILAKSSFSLPYLSELIDIAIKEQLRPLKHICKLAILKSIGFDIHNIDILPLPLPLLRELKVFRYEI